jgi:hypothetical protein
MRKTINLALLATLVMAGDAMAQPIRMPSPGRIATTPRLPRADYRAAKRVAYSQARGSYPGMQVRLSRSPLHRGTTGQGGYELLWGVSVRQPGQRGWTRKAEAVGARREPNLVIPEPGYHTPWRPTGVMNVVNVMNVPVGRQEWQMATSSRDGMVVRTRGAGATGELYAITAHHNLKQTSQGTKRSRRYRSISSSVLTPKWRGATRTPVPENNMWREKVDTSASVSVHQILWAQGNRPAAGAANANANRGEIGFPNPGPLPPLERRVTLKQQFTRNVPFPPRSGPGSQ